MTTDAAAPAVQIRLPLVTRIVAGVMAIGGVVVIGSPIVQGFTSGPTAWLIWPVAFLVLWETVLLRTARMGIVTTGDGRLVVRNQLRTQTFERAQVEDVRRSAGGLLSPTQGALQLLLSDGSVLSLQATTRPFGGRRLEAQLEMLRGWLAETS